MEGSQQENKEQLQQEIKEDSQQMKVEFELSQGKKVAVELNGQDLLEEVRTFLMEQSQMVLFENFRFQLDNQTLQNYTPLAEMNVQHNSIIQVKINPFDLKSTLYHYNKVVHLVNNPCLVGYYFNDGTTKGKEEEKKKKEKEEEEESVEKWLKCNLGAYERLSEQNNSPSGIQSLVHSISQSGFNPVSGPRQLAGDLLYLQILTHENTTLHVTSSLDGFFLNRSESKHFDGQPKGSVFLSLIDLLMVHSAGFEKTWEKIVNDRSMISKGSQVMARQQLGYKYREKTWNKESRRQEWDVNANERALRDSLQIKNRDWNEELQLIKDLPGKDFLERINKTKVLNKVYGEFTECCREGVMQIVQGNVQSLNFYESEAYRIYQLNNVFFTVMAENIHHLQANVKNAQGESHPTVANSNQDLRNLNVLENYLLNQNEGEDKIDNIHLVNTVLIDYKGVRVLCQSIIPGILNDIQQSFKQGCMDEGETIMVQKDYDDIIGQVGKVFGLKESMSFLDTEGKKHTLQGSLEVKGIEGQDNKKYILDLLRLSVRDMNYPSIESQSGCVLRHELIESYQMVNAIQAAETNLKTQYDNTHEIANQAIKKSIEQEKDIQKKQTLQETFNKNLQEQYIERIGKLQKMIGDKDYRKRLQLNPNIGTPFEAEDTTQEERDTLVALANFLKTQMIPQLVQDLTLGDQIKICDSSSFSELFHQYGVNNRYIGEVLKAIDSKHKHLILMMERTVIVRCFKHVLRQLMSSVSFAQLGKVITHYFNIFFSKQPSGDTVQQEKEMKEKNNVQEQSQEQQQQQTNGKSKKNKNKKKNNKKKTNQDKETSSFGMCNNISEIPQMSMTSEQLWKEIKEIGEEKYGYTLGSSLTEIGCLQNRYNRMACLRDICQRTGIVVKSREYDLQQLSAFCVDDIIEVNPVVKSVQYKSQDVKQHMETGERLYQEGKVKEALECYSQACQLITNIFGHNHKDLALVFQKLSGLYLAKKDVQNALLYQKESYKVYATLNGSDDRHSAHALMTLGLYSHKSGLQEKALKYTMKALYFMSILGGEVYGDCLVSFVNLANIYMDRQQHQLALSVLFECLDNHQSCFNNGHFLVLYVYRHIVTAHKEIGDLKRALEYQDKVLSIMQEQKEQKDKDNKDKPRTQQTLQYEMFFQNEKNIHAHLKQQIDNKMNNKAIGDEKDGKRQFGSNKAQKKILQNQVTETQNNQQKEKEKEELKEKLKLAKLTKITGRQGFRPNQQFNSNLYWINQHNQNNNTKE